MTRGCISGRSTRISSAGKNEYGCMIGMKEHIEIQKDAWTHTYSLLLFMLLSVLSVTIIRGQIKERGSVCLSFPFSFTLFISSSLFLYSSFLLSLSLHPIPNLFSFSSPFTFPFRFPFAYSPLVLIQGGWGEGAFTHTTYKSIKTQSLE